MAIRQAIKQVFADSESENAVLTIEL